MRRFRVKNPRAELPTQAHHEFLLRTSYAVKELETEAIYAFSQNSLEWYRYLASMMKVQKSAELMGADSTAAKNYLTDVSKPDEIVHLQAAFGGPTSHSTDESGRGRAPGRGPERVCRYCQENGFHALGHSVEYCFRDPSSPRYMSGVPRQDNPIHNQNRQGGGRQSRPVSRPQNGTGNASNNNHFQRRGQNNNSQSQSRNFSPLGQGNSMQPFSVPAPPAPSQG
jgi:hypothetical protein